MARRDALDRLDERRVEPGSAVNVTGRGAQVVPGHERAADEDDGERLTAVGQLGGHLGDVLPDPLGVEQVVRHRR